MTTTEPTTLPAWLNLDAVGLTDDVRAGLLEHRARVISAIRGVFNVVEEAKAAHFAAEYAIPEGLSEDLSGTLFMTGELGALHDVLDKFGTYVSADSRVVPAARADLMNEMNHEVSGWCSTP